jgi:hypothetical protein
LSGTTPILTENNQIGLVAHEWLRGAQMHSWMMLVVPTS